MTAHTVQTGHLPADEPDADEDRTDLAGEPEPSSEQPPSADPVSSVPTVRHPRDHGRVWWDDDRGGRR